MNRQVQFNADRVHLHNISDDLFIWEAASSDLHVGVTITLNAKQAEQAIDKLKPSFDEHYQVKKRHFLVRDNARVMLTYDRSISIMAATWKSVWEIAELMDIPNKRKVAYYFIGDCGVTVSYVDVNHGGEDPILEGLFGDLNVDMLYHDYMSARDPILILYGVPGVGKTTFLKYIMQRANDISIAYIKDAGTMKSSRTWKSLQDEDHDILILDDLDMDLLRGKERDDFITQLLSFSDGIFGKRTKIVITTNTPIQQIDNALVRPGRCFDFVYLRPLTLPQAEAYWTDSLGCDPDTLVMKGNEITQADLMQQYFAIRESREPRRYLPKSERCTLTELLSRNGVAIQGRDDKFGL